MAAKAIDMVTPVTAETFQRLNFSAGIALHSIDIANVADAEALVALMEANRDKWFGATKGNPRINENKSHWEPSINGKRLPFKGEKKFDTARPTLGITLVEFTPENMKAASGCAEVEDAETDHAIVKPVADVTPDSYFSNIVVVLNNGDNGLYAVELKNALCISGANTSFTDKDVGSIDVEFVAHADSPTSSKYLPIEYHFFASPTD